jgi:catechol 2,3-dioxygenase-like lactoylglutathione lyase family enzyme
VAQGRKARASGYHLAMPDTDAPRLGLLDVIQVTVPDVPGAVAFYRDLLGARVIEEAYPHWARLRLGNVDLGVHAGESPAGGGAEPAFRVHDIRALREHLAGRGVRLVLDYHDIPGGVKIAFADPAGNRLGAVQYGTSVEALRRGA